MMKSFIVAVGEYDDELNFKIIEKEIFLHQGFKMEKLVDLE